MDAWQDRRVQAAYNLVDGHPTHCQRIAMTSWMLGFDLHCTLQRRAATILGIDLWELLREGGAREQTTHHTLVYRT